MGILDIFFKNKSKDVAKQRLTMVLAYERKGLAPNFIDSLRDDLIAELWISIPFKH